MVDEVQRLLPGHTFIQYIDILEKAKWSVEKATVRSNFEAEQVKKTRFFFEKIQKTPKNRCFDPESIITYLNGIYNTKKLQTIETPRQSSTIGQFKRMEQHVFGQSLRRKQQQSKWRNSNDFDHVQSSSNCEDREYRQF